MSKDSRKRALEALSVALLGDHERRYLAQAPLMAIVEAVAVLDEAGLLMDPEVADLDPDAPTPYTVTKAGPPAHAREEALRRRVERACSEWDCDEDLHDAVRKALDDVEVSDEALELCESLQDANGAAEQLRAAGFTGSVGSMVRDVLRALTDLTFAPAPEPQPTPAAEPELHILAGSKCFECGQTLNDSGVCTNRSCQMMPF